MNHLIPFKRPLWMLLMFCGLFLLFLPGHAAQPSENGTAMALHAQDHAAARAAVWVVNTDRVGILSETLEDSEDDRDSEDTDFNEAGKAHHLSFHREKESRAPFAFYPVLNRRILFGVFRL